MRAVLLMTLVLSLPSPAAARIAVEPLRATLREASDDVASCAARHRLPAGRYVVRIEVGPSGKVEGVMITDAPDRLAPAAASCLAAAYTRLAFPSFAAPPPSALSTVVVHGRVSRVPGAPSRSRRPERITVSWPFVLR